MKRIKNIVIGVIAAVVLVGIVGLVISNISDKRKEEDTVPLETVLENASELTTQKMVVTDVFEETKGSIPILTKNKFLVQYHTVVTAGFDVSEADIKENDKQIKVTIPHCAIDEDSISIKAEDLKLYDTNFALFNVAPEDLLEIEQKAEERAAEQAASSEYGLLDAADANAKKVVEGLYEQVADGREVVVEFQ